MNPNASNVESAPAVAVQRVVSQHESEYWLEEAKKIIPTLDAEKWRDYHAMQLRHAYDRGLVKGMTEAAHIAYTVDDTALEMAIKHRLEALLANDQAQAQPPTVTPERKGGNQ